MAKKEAEIPAAKPKGRSKTQSTRTRNPSDRAFEGALATAAGRLSKAILERAQAGERLALLNAEIPQLERTIVTLRQQLEPAQIPAMPEFLHRPNLPVFLPGPNLNLVSVTAEQQQKALQSLAELPQDFSRMGALPPTPKSQNEILLEDDGLPELE